MEAPSWSPPEGHKPGLWTLNRDEVLERHLHPADLLWAQGRMDGRKCFPNSVHSHKRPWPGHGLLCTHLVQTLPRRRRGAWPRLSGGQSLRTRVRRA